MRLDLDRIAGRSPAEITDQRYDAAVLIPTIDRGGDHHLLFTKRAADLDEHAGQMSFPGGGREPADDTIVDTALREADEEIGLRREEATTVGRLDDIRTITEYAVTPVVATVPDRPYERDPREVAEVVVLPVEALCDPANHECDRRDHPYYGEVVIHYFRVDGYTVWGATGRILVDVLESTSDWRAPMRSDRDLA